MADGLARSGFDIDLLEGKAREDAFAYVILKARIEHKCDEKCRVTGNIFIEYRQKGRPSGISVTTADWWAIEYDENCWILIPTKRLKALARRVAADVKRRVKGGDNNQYDGILIPIEWLVRAVKATK